MTEQHPSRPSTANRLRPASLGVIALTFLVIGMAAPFGAVVANTPLAIAYGNGIGVPGAFVIAGAVLIIFASGFTAMAQRVQNGGAFYAFVQAGLGRRAGIAAGYLALGSYNILVTYVGALLAYFASSALSTYFGLDVPWIIIAIIALTAVFFLSARGTREGAIFTGVLLAAEIVLLAAICIGVLVTKGPGAYPVESFSPETVFSGNVGIALAFGFLSYIGFEATAVFSEEAKNPKKTVPRATFLAVGIITVIYVLANWSGIAGIGAESVLAFTTGADAGNMYSVIADDVLGQWAAALIPIVMLTSLFATLVAGHSTTSRYFYALARAGAFFPAFATTHRRFQTPVRAGLLQWSLSVVALIICFALGLDPYIQVAAISGVLGALGVVALQAAAAVAIFVYFRRLRDKRVWTSMISPVLAFLGLAAAVVLIVQNFGFFAGGGLSTTLVAIGVLLAFVVAGAIIGGRAKPLDLDQLEAAVPIETVPVHNELTESADTALAAGTHPAATEKVPSA